MKGRGRKRNRAEKEGVKGRGGEEERETVRRKSAGVWTNVISGLIRLLAVVHGPWSMVHGQNPESAVKQRISIPMI